MLHMQHFVEHDVIHYKSWNTRCIKDPADNNAMTSGVISPQGPARSPDRPGDPRLIQAGIEIIAIEPIETVIQIHVAAMRPLSTLNSASRETCNARTFLNIRAENEPAVCPAATHFALDTLVDDVSDVLLLKVDTDGL
jgi:hypothetical protein